MLADGREGERMFVVDRFEGDWAVVEYGDRNFNIPRWLLPAGCKEGTVLTIRIRIDEEATSARTSGIEKLAQEVFED